MKKLILSIATFAILLMSCEKDVSNSANIVNNDNNKVSVSGFYGAGPIVMEFSLQFH